MRQAAEEGRLDADDWKEIRKRARAGDAGAQFLLSFAELSPRTRRKWLRAAAEQGHAEAFNELYDGFPVDNRGNWLLLAAEQGIASAQSALGCYFATLPEPDLENSRYWYEQAALQGIPTAMYETGFTLLLGEGGPADPEMAVTWLERSLEGDESYHSDEVPRLLAQLYESGLYGVSKDKKRAKFWKARSTPRT